MTAADGVVPHKAVPAHHSVGSLVTVVLLNLVSLLKEAVGGGGSTQRQLDGGPGHHVLQLEIHKGGVHRIRLVGQGLDRKGNFSAGKGLGADGNDGAGKLLLTQQGRVLDGDAGDSLQRHCVPVEFPGVGVVGQHTVNIHLDAGSGIAADGDVGGGACSTSV